MREFRVTPRCELAGWIDGFEIFLAITISLTLINDYGPGSILSLLYTLIHLILTTVLSGRFSIVIPILQGLSKRPEITEREKSVFQKHIYLYLVGKGGGRGTSRQNE